MSCPRDRGRAVRPACSGGALRARAPAKRRPPAVAGAQRQRCAGRCGATPRMGCDHGEEIARRGARRRGYGRNINGGGSTPWTTAPAREPKWRAEARFPKRLGERGFGRGVRRVRDAVAAEPVSRAPRPQCACRSRGDTRAWRRDHVDRRRWGRAPGGGRAKARRQAGPLARLPIHGKVFGDQ